MLRLYITTEIFPTAAFNLKNINPKEKLQKHPHLFFLPLTVLLLWLKYVQQYSPTKLNEKYHNSNNKLSFYFFKWKF